MSVLTRLFPDFIVARRTLHNAQSCLCISADLSFYLPHQFQELRVNLKLIMRQNTHGEYHFSVWVSNPSELGHHLYRALWSVYGILSNVQRLDNMQGIEDLEISTEEKLITGVYIPE